MWYDPAHSLMKLATITICLVAVLIGTAASASDFAPIIARYGGAEGLAKSGYREMRGRECIVGRARASMPFLAYLPPCEEFTTYQTPLVTRAEYRQPWLVWQVQIIERDKGFQFYEGLWPSRALYAWLFGLRDGPIDPRLVAALNQSNAVSVFTFLSKSDALEARLRHDYKTIDGKEADGICVPVDNVFVLFLFDPQTNVLTEKIVASRQANTQFVYSDFRDIGGVPFPFRTDEYDGSDLIKEIFEDSVRIGIHPTERLFKAPFTQPLWVEPTIALAILLAGGGVAWMVFLVRGRRRG